MYLRKQQYDQAVAFDNTLAQVKPSMHTVSVPAQSNLLLTADNRHCQYYLQQGLIRASAWRLTTSDLMQLVYIYLTVHKCAGYQSPNSGIDVPTLLLFCRALKRFFKVVTA